MATAPNMPTGMKAPGTGPSRQLRRDRIAAVVVVAILVAMMGLLIWLASLGTGAPDNIYDFWPMMP